ncbi:MAG: BON domain-containing protein [Bdellovibrionaceae bacterium]|nr:BON domain-containing protein [Pseudobdellovibrionaceae bacterium]
MANIRYDRFYQYNPYNPEYPTSPFYHGAEDGYGRNEPVTRYSDEGHISYADRAGSRPYQPNFSADYGRDDFRAMSMPEGGIYGETIRGSHAGKGPKGWSRSDERIRDQVCDTLEMDAYIDASEIEVEVKEGIVTLSGKVDHRSTKRRAADRIENLPGVRDVDNNLTIDQSFFQQAKEMLTGEPEARATHRGQGPKSARH